jgi:hypothetical protein
MPVGVIESHTSMKLLVLHSVKNSHSNEPKEFMVACSRAAGLCRSRVQNSVINVLAAVEGKALAKMVRNVNFPSTIVEVVYVDLVAWALIVVCWLL